MAGNFRRHEFATRDDLARALAKTVGDRLSERIAAAGTASLAVSGGSTPAHFFDVLSDADIDWSRVQVTLVDERYVPASSARSNAGLVQAKLIQNRAAKADFMPLYASGNVAADIQSASQRLAALKQLDVVVLGMGNDGHTASFFPDADELEQLLDTGTTTRIAAVHAASAGESRLTLTLPVIASAGFVALHIEGAEKRATLERALGPSSDLPIRRVIDAAATPVEIYWAP